MFDESTQNGPTGAGGVIAPTNPNPVADATTAATPATDADTNASLDAATPESAPSAPAVDPSFNATSVPSLDGLATPSDAGTSAAAVADVITNDTPNTSLPDIGGIGMASSPIVDNSTATNQSSSTDAGLPDLSQTLGESAANNATNSTGDSGLVNIKQQALQSLSPLLNHLDQTPEEKFRTTMMLIQASDDQSLVQSAYDAAQAITDEKAKAQALLDVVNEINYFTQHGSGAK